jgi:hypothetical protein
VQAGASPPFFELGWKPLNKRKEMNIWVYKVNSRRRAGPPAWHFNRFFHSVRRGPYELGGREWIRSPQSWARLREVRTNDLFVCYQSDERKIYGFARAAGPGYESLRGSGIFDSVDFRPGGFRLKAPLPVALRSTAAIFRNIPAFTVPSRGTIHGLRRDELRAIAKIAIRWNPSQAEAIAAYLARS